MQIRYTHRILVFRFYILVGSSDVVYLCIQLFYLYIDLNCHIIIDFVVTVNLNIHACGGMYEYPYDIV